MSRRQRPKAFFRNNCKIHLRKYCEYGGKIMVGDPVKDSLMLAEVSPALNADKIKSPLLIVQGAKDPRVNVSESNQMVEGLRSRGVDVPYIVKENEGHGFHNEENKFEFYEAMEDFFKKYLGDN